MATLKQRLHRKTDSGTYDVVHLETSADIVEYDENNSIKDIIENVSATASAVYSEIPSLKSSVSEGKRQVASAITDRGVSTASDASFSTMADNIRKIDKVITGTPTLNKDFIYTGSCQVIDDSTEAYNEWRIKFLTSGTLKFTANIAVDIFLVGGGGGGAGHVANSSGTLCSGGGGGGYTKTLNNITLNKNVSYSIVIGNGGVKGDRGVAGNVHNNYGRPGGSTSISAITNGTVTGGIGGGGPIPTGDTSIYANNGGAGGSGGGSGYIHASKVISVTRSTRATNGNNGTKCNVSGTVMGWGTPGTGQGSTTKEFGDNGATSYSMGGASGGNDVAYGIVSNSGNGGDGLCHSGSNVYSDNTDGSSGILIIRKHKT